MNLDGINLSTHNRNNGVYDFFFEPAKIESTSLKVLAFATLFFLSVATLGLWLVPFFALSSLSSRVEKKGKDTYSSLDAAVKGIVENSPPFKGYAIQMDEGSPYRGATLTSVAFRPANIFLQKLFTGTEITHTLPGSGKLFAFNKDHRKIGQKLRTMIDLDPDRVIEVSARGFEAAVLLPGGKRQADLSALFGEGTYRISMKEVGNILDNQKIFTSSRMPLKFYMMLKLILRAGGFVTLPGTDLAPCKLKDIAGDEPQRLLNKIRVNPSQYGIDSEEQLEWLLNKTLYQLGSLVVKTEDYHCFLDGDGKIRERNAGETPPIRLISACGIRGILHTPDEDNLSIMQDAFTTALVAAEKDYVAFPAVGMGVWRGDPDLYWSAFLEAVASSAGPIEQIFVNPRHQQSAIGKFKGCSGEEFALLLDQFLEKYRDDEGKLANLKKVISLYEDQQDLVQLALNLKQAFPEKTVSLFNASDPDVTLGNHVGEYVNNVPHTFTTEENYTAMGTNGLCFENITGVLSDALRIFQVRNGVAAAYSSIYPATI